MIRLCFPSAGHVHQIFRLLMCMFFSLSVSAQISGTKTIGASGGTYTSITAAIADATSSGINGALILELLSSYSSSSETYPITIGSINGTSATNTVTIRPASGVTGLGISSANSTATLLLSGARYIVIDGRPGGSGTKDLVISNTSTAANTLTFINDACFNLVKYAYITGVNSSAASGVVFFSTTSGIRGNDSNTIDNCDIKDGATSPATSLYSLGNTSSIALGNSNNFITNNNIYNFWNATTENNAFKISGGNTDWVITGNSIYQTAARVATAAFQQYFFNMNNPNANNHIISNNYIGGSAPQCGGSAMNMSGTSGFRITGGYMNCGSTIPMTFSNNIFANISLTSSGTAYTTIPGVFSGPWLVNGTFIITGNTFGSMSSTQSIVVNNGVTGNLVVPIGSTSTTAGLNIISKNNFGGIDVQVQGSAVGSVLNLISVTTATSSMTYNIDSNVMGGSSADNIIASTTTNAAQTVAGIINNSSAYVNVRGNVIRNFRNNYIGTSTANAGWLHALDFSGASVDTVTGNQIYNLVSNNIYQANNTGSASLTGIRFVPSSTGNLVSQNQIYGLNQVNAGANAVASIGIVLNNITSSLITKNLIHSFNSTSAASTLMGIYLNAGGTPTITNNLIRLGIDANGNAVSQPVIIYDIYRNGGNLIMFNNTCYVGGSGVASGAVNTYAFSSITTGTDSIYNNIFSNERSSSGGAAHYAIGLSGNTTLAENKNIFYASGTGGSLGLFGATPASTLSAWITASGVDAGSFLTNPQLVSPMGSSNSLDLHISSPGNKGFYTTTVPIDYDGDRRSNPPDIGADEIPFDIGVNAIDAPTTATFCGQSKSVIVHLKNYGLLSVTSANINVLVNGVLKITYAWTGLLAAGGTSPAINAGSYSFTGGSYALAVFSSLPNGNSDNNFNNDTSYVQFNVTPSVTPTLVISTPANPVCINTSVSFTAKTSYAGSTPTFQWKRNSTTVGTNDSSYSL